MLIHDPVDRKPDLALTLMLMLHLHDLIQRVVVDLLLVRLNLCHLPLKFRVVQALLHEAFHLQRCALLLLLQAKFLQVRGARIRRGPYSIVSTSSRYGTRFFVWKHT